MKRMSLFGGDKKQEDDGYGRDIPGMVSMYLVAVIPRGYYQSEDSTGALVTTDNWDAAKHFFGFVGLQEAKSIAQKYDGKVCIVSCTPIKPYKETTL